MRYTVALAIVVALAACPSSPQHPTPVDDTPLRLRVAHAEARRADGVAELLTLAGGTKAERLLALRGLGRIGGPKAKQLLMDVVTLDHDPDILGVAAGALGIAASLDDEPGSEATLLAGALARAGRHDVDVIEAIGRAGDAPAEKILTWTLIDSIRSPAPSSASSFPAVPRPPPSDPAARARASALALGRYGRRKIELTDAARDALIEATRHRDPQVRYAAAYALAREQLPKADPKPPQHPNMAEAATRLAFLLDDPDASVRAIAAQALARRKTLANNLAAAAYDTDWRVAVEAIRALASEVATDEQRSQAADAVLAWLRVLDRDDSYLGANKMFVDARAKLGKPGEAPKKSAEAAHVVIEGLRALLPHAKVVAPKPRGQWGTLFDEAQMRGVGTTNIADLSRFWIVCLARAGALRAADKPDYKPLAECPLPDHLRMPLVADAIAAKVGTIEQRREALRPLLAHADPRVRVAGMTALAALWPDGSAADHRATATTIAAALADKDGLVAGTAVEAAGTIYEAGDKDTDTDWRSALDAALIARAQIERDAELAGSLFELIGKRSLAAGAPACKAGLAGAPVLAKAAASCLKALGQPVDMPAIGAAQPPPVDLALVVGKRVRWKLETTRGVVEIDLDPDRAPWAVATIATLTRKGFYDGLELHRVVPNFVVQGGDPTQSGWGGPGFAIPAEPSSGAGYLEGGVGMADAGRDSAGSQWFIMHGPAPHLDGRYTWVGRVASGQSSANSLQIGDRITHATVDIAPRL